MAVSATCTNHIFSTLNIDITSLNESKLDKSLSCIKINKIYITASLRAKQLMVKD